MGHGDPNTYSFTGKKWVECWETGAEVRKGKDQSDTRVSCWAAGWMLMLSVEIEA